MASTLKYKLLSLLLVSANFILAQQNSLFNTYAYDPLQLNIAYSGAACTEANLHYRTQWIGLKEAPSLIQLNAHTALGKSNGVGLRINSQKMGLINNLAATAGYSYRFNVNPGTKVHLGIGIGWSQASLLSQNAVVLDDDDLTLNNKTIQTANGFDSEFGAMLVGRKIKAGFSALHLYNSNPDFTGTSQFKLLPQLNTQFSYVFFKDQKIELEPWVLNRLTLKGDNVIEGLLKVNFLKSFNAGVGYRSRYGFLAIFGARFSNINIAYSIDYGVTKNATNTGTSHQVMLGFNMCRKVKPTEPKPEEPVVVIEPTVVPTPTVVPEVPVVIEEPKVEPVVVETKTETIVKEEPISEPVLPEVLPKLVPEEVNSIAVGIVFSIGSYSISPENDAKIKSLSEVINARSGNVVIVGYASPDGDKHKNDLLAIHRAEVVKKALVKYGVKSERLGVRNGGETESVNKNLEGNRTVRFE
jgi:type IX secretion system PorP/SprF family membrane protein